MDTGIQIVQSPGADPSGPDQATKRVFAMASRHVTVGLLGMGLPGAYDAGADSATNSYLWSAGSFSKTFLPRCRHPFEFKIASSPSRSRFLRPSVVCLNPELAGKMVPI